MKNDSTGHSIRRWFGDALRVLVAVAAFTFTGETYAVAGLPGWKNYTITDHWWVRGVLQTKKWKYTIDWDWGEKEKSLKPEQVIMKGQGSDVGYDKAIRPKIKLNGATMPDTTGEYTTVDENGKTAKYHYTAAKGRYTSYYEGEGYVTEVCFISLETPGAVWRFSGKDTSGRVMIVAKENCIIKFDSGTVIGGPDNRVHFSAVSPVVCFADEVVILNEGNGYVHLYGNVGCPAIATHADRTCTFVTSDDGWLVAHGGKGAPAIGSSSLEGADDFFDVYFETRDYSIPVNIGCGTINILGKVAAYTSGDNEKGECAIGVGNRSLETSAYDDLSVGESVINVGTEGDDSARLEAFGAPAIGSSNGSFAELNINIMGGVVRAENRTGLPGPAIGAGYSSWKSHGEYCNVTISGGDVRAGVYGGVSGPGIGKSSVNSAPTKVVITGGKVEALGGSKSCGIGFHGDPSSELKISGGTIESEGDPESAWNDMASADVTGGSIKVKKPGGMLNQGRTCNCITVGGLPAGGKIDASAFGLNTALGAYGANDVYADLNGRIYIWPPAADYGGKLTVGGETYVNADSSAGAVTAKREADMFATITFFNPRTAPYTTTTKVLPTGEPFGANLPNQPDRNGDKFIGWYTTQDGEGTKITAEAIVTGDRTYYARYASSQPEVFTVYFQDNYVTVDTISGEAGAKYGPLPAAPDKPGYQFLGWFLTVSGNAAQATENTKFTQNMSWQARWKKVGGAVSGYTWYYRLDLAGNAEIYNVTDPDEAAISPAPSGSLTIPSKLDGHPVTAIGENAFKGCGMTSVTIPSSVTRIASSAFYDCDSLGSVNIPGSVKTIGERAFFNCKELATVTLNNGVESIGKMAFADCAKLKTVTIPDSVTSIGIMAFTFCDAITTLNMSDTDREILMGAFLGCNGLANGDFVVVSGILFGCRGNGNSVTVPSGVHTIDTGAFAREDNILLSRTVNTLTIPESVQAFREDAFRGTGLNTVNLTFAEGSTADMVARRDVVKAAVETTGYTSAVTYNLPMATVTFIAEDGTPASQTKSVQAGTAIGATLDAVTVPTLDEDHPFGCWLTEPYGDNVVTAATVVRGNVKYYAKWMLPGEDETRATVKFDANGGTLEVDEQNIREGAKLSELPDPTREGWTFDGWWTDPEGGTKITEETLAHDGVTYYAHWSDQTGVEANGYTWYYRIGTDGNAEIYRNVKTPALDPVPTDDAVVTIPDTLGGKPVTSIGGDAFYGCAAMKRVNFPATIKSIASGAFIGCSSLEAVSLPEGLLRIWPSAFQDCSSLTDVTIPSTVTSIGNYAFLRCTGLKTVVYRCDYPTVGTQIYTGTPDDLTSVVAVGAAGWETYVEAGTWQARPITQVGKGEEIDYINAGEYFNATLTKLGFDVPTDGTAYSVKALGLPGGMALKSNKAQTSWWIEGSPTAALDYITTPAYLVITVNGAPRTEPLRLGVIAQDVTSLGELTLGETVKKTATDWLVGISATGWTVTGLPSGLKYTAKAIKKVAAANTVYGKPTKAGLFTITAKKLHPGTTFYDTKKYQVLVRPKDADPKVFPSLSYKESMAYDEPVMWNLKDDVASAGGNVTKVTGLPPGLTFAAKDTYAYKNAKKKTGKYLKQKGQTIKGTPTKPGLYAVTFTKNVKSGKKTVAKTAQILWRITPNTYYTPTLDFNTSGGVVKTGMIGLKYDELDFEELYAFSATEGAKVSVSGLPKGVSLVENGFGNWTLQGTATKTGTYLVTVKATVKGITVTQRIAVEMKGLPDWAKGTFNGRVEDGNTWDVQGLAAITISSAGKISGKFQRVGQTWTFSVSSFTDYNEESKVLKADVTVKRPYKVKSGKKTVTKYENQRMTLMVSQDGSEGKAQMMSTFLVTGFNPWVTCYQNFWKTKYKTLGQKLFYTSKKKPYKTVTKTVIVGEGDQAQNCKVSLKITPAGVVTATLTYNTGKKKKGKVVYYKPTCSTVVDPYPDTDPNDPAAFNGLILLYFAPSAGNNFPGCSSNIPWK